MTKHHLHRCFLPQNSHQAIVEEAKQVTDDMRDIAGGATRPF